MKLLSLHPSFNEKPPHLLWSVNGECSNTVPTCTWITFPYSSAYWSQSLSLHMSNEHIRCYHMDATHSVGLAWAYFSHPDFLVVWCWICTTIFIFRHCNPHRATCLLLCSFQGAGYAPLGAPCDHILAILDHSDIAWSFVTTAFPAL